MGIKIHFNVRRTFVLNEVTDVVLVLIYHFVVRFIYLESVILFR